MIIKIVLIIILSAYTFILGSIADKLLTSKDVVGIVLGLQVFANTILLAFLWNTL